MSGQRSNPRPVPDSLSSATPRGRSSPTDPASRATSIARLALSPAASTSTSIARRTSTPGHAKADNTTPLAGAEGSSSASGPGQSALAAALQGSFGSPPRFGTPPRASTPNLAATSAIPTATTASASGNQSTYGSFDTRSTSGLPARPNENLDIVKRHLVQPSTRSSSKHEHNRTRSGVDNFAPTLEQARRQKNAAEATNDDFSSLQLQGGDMTREVYRWTEDAESQSERGPRGKRSRSFHISRPEPENDTYDIASIKVPGGFRRNYLRRQIPANSGHESRQDSEVGSSEIDTAQRLPSRFFTSSFLEFLTLYGHFAGEELEEIKEEDEESEEYYASDAFATGRYFDAALEDGDERLDGEETALLRPSTPARRKRKPSARGPSGRSTPLGAASMLLKSFVGTGVLFLPKAYLNGGMLFSNLVLLGVAALSYYCFILLVQTRLKVEASFGDMGGILYGQWLRALILSSVALSQIGFVSAYIVFTSENLQAFILAVSNCRTWIDIKFMVLMQLIIFLPLSLIRDISALSLTAYIADFFIMLGLLYLYYYDIFTIVVHKGFADVVNFNPQSWSLFIGTAIFTFEGVGLIIPIQESMRHPSKFPPVLAAVMMIITVVFVSMGALSYAAFGSSTKTVVLLNLPQDDKFVNAVQFLYSLAIILSTPLQLFPAIRIIENELFTRSGKNDFRIKTGKNVFRFCLVMICALIAWGGAGDLDKFVAIIGTFCCLPLVYVYPAMLHFRAVAQSRRQQVIDVILCIFGFVVMVYTTTLTVRDWAGGSGPKARGYYAQKNLEMGTEQLSAQVRVQLTTARTQYALPDQTGPILVNTRWGSLDEYLTQHGISSETTLNLEYIQAAIPPVHLASFEHDDWVSSVDVLSRSSAAGSLGREPDAQRPGHERILSASYDGLLRIWNMSSQVLAASPSVGEGGHAFGIKGTKFISPTQIASSSIDRTIRLWKYRESPDESISTISPQVELHGHMASVDAIAVHQPSSKILSASADHSVGLWSTKKLNAPALPEPTMPSSNLRGAKRRKVGSSVSTPQRGPLVLMKSHSAPVSSVTFAPNDPTVAYSASWDHELKTWDLTTSTLIDTRSTSHTLLSLAALPAMNLVATGTSARHIALVDPRASATSVVAMTLRGHTNAVVSLATDPKSIYGLASGSHDGTCRIWDVRSTRTEKEGRIGQSLYSIGRESTRGEPRAAGDGIKVFGLAWDSDVGIVSAGEDKHVQINRARTIN
ncbi:MAG: hypothetical protein Q9222_001791 [Ikaeria aurantiellina]